MTETTDITSEISGSGGFKKTGPGTLILSVQNSYTGPTEIAAGTLSIAHQSALISTTSVKVDSGATLKCGAESPLSYAIGGPYIQLGTLTINISPTACDCLNIAGPATLGGHLVLNGLVADYAHDSGYYPILTATGGFGASRFLSVSVSGNSGFIFKSDNLIYSTNTIFLQVDNKKNFMTINLSWGDMVLQSARSLSSIIPTSVNQLMIGSIPAVSSPLNNSLTIKVPLTGLASIEATGLERGGVIRLTGVTTPSTGYTASALSGFTAAFGIPAPIWGVNNPWVIIAPATAPTYAYRHDSPAIVALLDAAAVARNAIVALSPSANTVSGSLALIDAITTARAAANKVIRTQAITPLGWADGIAAPATIESAIVMDPPALAALVAATAKSTILNPAAALGITDTPEDAAGRWNIGVTSCGLPGFSVPGAHLRALLAAITGGRLVIANGAIIN